MTGSVKYGTESVDEKERQWTEIFELVEGDGGLKIQSERVFAVGALDRAWLEAG